MIIAKFRVEQVTFYSAGGGSIILVPVTSGSAENEQFFKYTPSGKIEMSIVTTATLKLFEVGKEYYVKFEPAFEVAE